MQYFSPELKEKVQQAIAEWKNKELKTMSISDMMSKHVIVDVNEHIHVVDGKVIYYEPDTIDFEDENQVRDFFEIVSEIFVNELLPERYGKGNTYAVITGIKSDRTKSISTQGMHHFPSEIMEKVKVAVDEYRERACNTL